CLIRETLGRHSGLADFAFAMQGLGSGAISIDGTPEQKRRYLTRVARGEAIAAFALSEPDAGSDVAAMTCSARAEGDHVVLDGEKTWISNGGIADFFVVFARRGGAAGAGGVPDGERPCCASGGIADFYVVFARSGEAPGARGLSAFVVEAGAPGVTVADRIEGVAPHPLPTL